MMIDFRKFSAGRSRVVIVCTSVVLSGQGSLALAADRSGAPQASAPAAAVPGNKQIAAIGIPKDAAVKDTGTASGGTSGAPANSSAAAATAATAAPAAATPATAAPAAATPAGTTPAATGTTAEGDQNAGKVMLKPGQTLVVPSLVTEDLQPTDDPLLAAEQVAAYADSPEAHFIYAVALTRTSRVEEALREVRQARRLAMAKGGYAYFDKMIQSYEEVLASSPEDNRIRYGLAWAYYMKAYLLSQDSKKAQAVIAPDAPPAKANPDFSDKATKKTLDAGAANAVINMISPDLAQKAAQMAGKVNATQLPHLQSPKEQAAPFAVAEINKYYDLAIKHLDDLLVRKPDDVWAGAYRWHLYAEHTGDMDSAMAHWKELSKRFPNNPALYLFMGEGWLKKGNLKEAIQNASHAIMLRGLGN